jgi:hypothetical protein
MYIPGKRILKTIELFKDKGLNVVRKGNTYRIEGRNYNLKIEVEPTKWLGLEFTMPSTKIVYLINTDLYDINSPEYGEFTHGIEDDIVSFLSALLKGEIKVHKRGANTKVFVPLGDTAVILKAGRFFSSAKTYNKKREAEAKFDKPYTSLAP